MAIPDGYVPLSELVLSRSNTRMMEVTPELVLELRDRFNICQLTRTAGGDTDIESQITEIRKHPAYKHRITAGIAAELKRIGKFACSLHGDPTNLLNPIRYIDRGDHKEVSIGNNRFLTHLLMRADYIKAEPIEYANDEERMEMELAENLQRTDLPQRDLLLALKMLQDSKGRRLTATEVQTHTQKSRGSAHSITAILGYEDPILFEQIRAGYYKSIHAAYKASLMPPSQLRADITQSPEPTDKPKSLFKLHGTGRDMEDAMLIINEMIGTLTRHYQVLEDKDYAAHAQQRVNSIAAELARVQIKDREGKYAYDKRAIQKGLDDVISLFRDMKNNLLFQAKHANTLADLDKE